MYHTLMLASLVGLDFSQSIKKLFKLKAEVEEEAREVGALGHLRDLLVKLYKERREHPNYWLKVTGGFAITNKEVYSEFITYLHRYEAPGVTPGRFKGLLRELGFSLPTSRRKTRLFTKAEIDAGMWELFERGEVEQPVRLTNIYTGRVQRCLGITVEKPERLKATSLLDAPVRCERCGSPGAKTYVRAGGGSPAVRPVRGRVGGRTLASSPRSFRARLPARRVGERRGLRVLMVHDCAGVGLSLACYLRERGVEADLVYFSRGHRYLRYRNHIFAGHGLRALAYLAGLIPRYDVVHLHTGTAFPSVPVPVEMLYARMLGRRVVVHFHGSDLRMHHRSLNVRILTKNSVVLVSTPDLLEYAPSAVWLRNPVPVDFKPVLGQPEPHEGTRILHVATNERVKGTWYVERAVRELRRRGYRVELRIVGERNPVPHSMMPQMYAWADIVAGQFVIGIYSIAEVEAMVSGRPVATWWSSRGLLTLRS